MAKPKTNAQKARIIKQIIILAFLSYGFLMLGNSKLNLTNSDEVFYAQTSREMIRHNTWTTPYLFDRPQFEKPILIYILLKTVFILFGASNFSARFFPALSAMIGVIAVYLLGAIAFKDDKKAFLSSLILMSSVLYIGLARSVSTDMIFSVLILLSLVSFFWGYSRHDKKAAGLVLSFIFSGLAILAKGPLGAAIPFLIIVSFLLFRKDIKFLLCRYTFLGFFILAAISLPWYVLMIKKYGHSFMHEFFYNVHIRRVLEAEHKGSDTWYFYPSLTIAGLFPWSLFGIASLIALPRLLLKKKDPAYLFLTCWVCVCFLVFQFAHSKLISYTFPMFPALALIMGGFIFDNISALGRPRRLFSFVLWGTLGIISLIPIGTTIALTGYSAQIAKKISLASIFPLYILNGLFLGLILLFLFLILRNRLLKSVYTIALVMLLVLAVLPLVCKDIGLYVSSQDACEYLLKNYKVDNTILCSKIFVRGVRYYTDRDVAVVGVGGEPFFSPHPIPYLDSDPKIKEFLSSQKVTYCIVKKGAREDIERVSDKKFKCEVLKVIGNAYILRVTPS